MKVFSLNGSEIPVQRFVSGDERTLYMHLCHLGNAIVIFAKAKIYSKIMSAFKHPEAYLSLCQLSCSPGVLAQIKKTETPYKPQQMAHQFMRTVLHLHDAQIQAIVLVYLRLLYKCVEEYYDEAFATLVFALKREVNFCSTTASLGTWQ